MWSVRYRLRSETPDTFNSTCAVCRQEVRKTIIREKKLLTVLLVFRFPLGMRTISVCPNCRVRKVL